METDDVKKVVVIEEIVKPKVEEKEDFMDVLKAFAPGTSIRSAVDDILEAGMGALIVVDKEGLSNILEGGFKVNCKFSHQRIVELAKMDGAIIVSKDMKKILQANVLLTPSVKFSTRETGTRHKAGERTAQHVGTAVVAVSERKRKITLYWKNLSYVLEQSSELLRKAAETLQILEKQKETFDELLLHLNILELTNLVSKTDICNILQKIEIIDMISERVKRYLIELGKEGIIVSMRLKELTKNILKERDLILEDYFGEGKINVELNLESMSFDSLLETSNVLQTVFETTQDGTISPRGKRLLKKINLPEKNVELLITHFGTLDKIFDATKEDLKRLLEDDVFAGYLFKVLDNFRTKIISGRKI